MTILLLAEHDGLRLSPDTARAVGALIGLGDTVHVLVAGSGVGDGRRAVVIAFRTDVHRTR